MFDDGLFGPSAEPDEPTPDELLLGACVRVEVELLGALHDAGLVDAGADGPPDARLRAALERDWPAPGDLAGRMRAGGNLAIPLVADLLDAAPEDLRAWVHLGATSQDVVDTAQALLLKEALRRVAADLAGGATAAAELAVRHAATARVGRTLGQAAVPTTFGLTCAGWAVGLDRAARAARVAAEDLALSLAGAAGTAGVHGASWEAVATALGRRLDLPVPDAPWHTERSRVRAAAAALAGASAAAAKVGTDVAALAVTEVGELTEGGAGGSSAMPHKRNPVRSALLRAAGMRAPGLLSTVFAAALAENERATGAWHAEWQPLADLVRLGRGSAERVTELLDRLDVDEVSMSENLDAARPHVMSEALSTALAPRLGRSAAQRAVAEALSPTHGRPPTDEEVRAALRSAVGDAPELDDPALLEPERALSAVPGLIERALRSLKENS
ncbi:lyase family protein [Georgenia sp. Z1491]|uniref:lyase family protein n=1 Tax=Georgenia sp. Z1491 TaxID=3416707 RepID=UPI003CE7EC3A